MSTKERVKPVLEPLTSDELDKKLAEGDQVLEEAKRAIQGLLNETGAALIERSNDQRESEK
jgi:hypothetical protein